VIAANNDGVWNESGASLAFVIPPAFVQTQGFQGLMFRLQAVRVRIASSKVLLNDFVASPEM
jgi:hypothetical protein